MHVDQETVQATIEVMNRADQPKTDRERVFELSAHVARLKEALDTVSLERDRLQAQVNTMRGRLPNALRALGV
jgi:hypothetical protein